MDEFVFSMHISMTMEACSCWGRKRVCSHLFPSL